jgi:hypothetical protein
LRDGKLSEGHTRPLLMLIDRPEEQMTLFKEIMIRRMTVREAELIARKTAFERARIKEDIVDLGVREIEDKLTADFGTRVTIEKKKTAEGGLITIAFFSDEDLKNLLYKLRSEKGIDDTKTESVPKETPTSDEIPTTELDDRSKDEIQKAESTENDEELYSIKNFSI